MNQSNQEMKLRKVIEKLNIKQFALYLFIKYQEERFSELFQFLRTFFTYLFKLSIDTQNRKFMFSSKFNNIFIWYFNHISL